MATWALAEAKAKFSEVVDRAVNNEPQEITRNGKAVAFLVSREEWLQTKHKVPGEPQSMLDFFRKSPLVGSGIDLRRRPSRARKVEL